MNKEELETLFSANEYLLKLIPGINRLAEEARSRNFENVRDLSDAMEGLGWLMEVFKAIDECNAIIVDVDTINENLNTVTDAIQQKDFTLLADVLEYEIEPLINDWLDELENILRSGGSIN